jgi:hypothetical protein
VCYCRPSGEKRLRELFLPLYTPLADVALGFVCIQEGMIAPADIVHAFAIQSFPTVQVHVHGTVFTYLCIDHCRRIAIDIASIREEMLAPRTRRRQGKKQDKLIRQRPK